MGEGDILPFKCGGDLGCNSGLPIGETGQDTFFGIWILLEWKFDFDTLEECIESLSDSGIG